MYELKVAEKIDHFNAANYFTVTEMESGEELYVVDHKLEAEDKMLKLIRHSNGKYFTSQDYVNGLAYRLTKCSNDVGVCEICKTQTEQSFMLIEMVRYWNPLDKKESLTGFGCRPTLFGHKECLSKLTFAQLS